MILKVGVTIVRYICHEHSAPWVTHSFRNLKGRGSREYLSPGEVSEGNQQQLSPDDVQVQSDHVLSHEDTETVSSSTSKTLGTDLQYADNEEQQEGSTVQSSVQDEPIFQEEKLSERGTPMIRSSRKSRLREMERAKQQGKLMFDPVHLMSRPWKKPEGGLNRTMFKRIIEGIMLYILSHPGSIREDIYKHFNPILQPVVALELLEILETAGCMKKIILKKKKKPSAFSKPEIISTASEEIGEENIYYNPTLDSIIKLSVLTEQI
ncbi:general transcription factor 3C polypeptide 1 isoform X3 [Lingula anatina]|uniref:General transcription factor 3C polypeptide 1 isoform X3 n=1 Tax=Lingula anatina TaxID=7574 RepID=A0A2R2MPU4_LINAN|nr:general transcription factor 3C polypeptide 1 isoform X3 [Lingula anatina]|eukprot:XP_023932259.1 general transcription factor 3C polypeptide 1 isoform X3 [Lingula anatina]